MATLNTRIVLKNDSSANWLANSAQVLLKGEVGIEFTAEGKAKLKIGDGVKTWEELEYFGGENPAVVGDGKSIVVEDGVIKAYGFDSAVAGAYMVKGADGSVSWEMPEKSITEINNAVNALQNTIGSAAEGETPATGIFAELEKKANAENVYTKDETEAAIATAIAGINHLERKIVASVDDIDVSAEGADKYIYMVPSADAEAGNGYDEYMVINGAVERIGNTKVDLSGYVKTEDFDALKAIVNDVPETYLTKNEAKDTLLHQEYEISNKPVNTLVDYRDKEIRVMCPADTAWELQNVGANGDASKYYIGFRAYAPNDNVVSFKEDLAQTIADTTMYYFEGNEFAGIDAYGRKYSIVWLPVAKHNDDDTWTYYGKGSSETKFVGWYYSVEWYNAEGKVVASDTIRINLTNEDCHNAIVPFYVSNIADKAINNIKIGGTLLDVVDNTVDIPVAGEALGTVKSSTEVNKVAVAADGSMQVNDISVNKLVQEEGDILILDGGAASM